MRPRAPLSAQGAMVELLSRRGYSRAQLCRKLQDKGYASTEIAEALDKAQSEGWINDLEYARSLTRSRVQSGYGPAYIRQYLIGKGISNEIAQDLMNDDQWDWWQAIERAFAKKYHAVPDDFKQKHRCQAYLYRRGFNSSIIREWLDSLT
ncbi:regulatory protein RecX [Celerinatantimonas diazotrophica]|uniref:Regulatory protein RecX n=1 Tax=Celerinatantimonas diazotrophica TaxID=412034 RepID=A0A4R1J9G5_9GAMM|nr:regulatory protein RecX [Celerinatantimonas diazotrophica]TCK47218.1 regulatory protein [Celerinatantimonas diazotrophica]CAG9295990.1 Regulatory protein RecX [Celerinatantimonas diazotrophica]